MDNDLAFGIILGVALISLLVVFCALLIKMQIGKTKTYTQTLYQKDLNFQKSLNATIIETQEQVLNNISQDLHDDAGQQLTSINFQLENLKLDSPELEKALAPISKSLGQLSQSIRSISHSLNQQVILKNNFIDAFDAEVKRLKKNKKIDVSFTFEELVKKNFSTNERIFIYRIFQECINNCLKHSKATSIDIAIKTQPAFEMVFSDNGIGFDEAASGGKVSMGMSNMKARAQDINYALLVESTPGKGTTIRLSQKKMS